MFRFTVRKVTNGYSLEVGNEVKEDGRVLYEEYKEYVFTKPTQLVKALKLAVSELEEPSQRHVPF